MRNIGEKMQQMQEIGQKERQELVQLRLRN